ncbi:hypothetical protein [Natronoglomus mannanivorans]|uniref:Uncharacterized protein n=1 Tax=Natronoglomus mannanivorans TaxID=2979990 RepID=A0AAP2Z237_9EURY|nr:hypothetical protein [Halobacteria archaeon AArc-xg1-1]
MTKNPENTKYGRCEATAKSSGDRCGRAAVGSHGKCDFHGGKSLKGEESPSFKHGLFSDYLGPEERETIEALGEYDDEDKLEELINWRLARLRRAVKAMDDPEEQRTFWDAFSEIVDKAGPVESGEIKELAKMLARGNSAMQQEIDLVRKLIKDHNNIAEGQDVNLGWAEMLAGGGDE